MIISMSISSTHARYSGTAPIPRLLRNKKEVVEFVASSHLFRDEDPSVLISAQTSAYQLTLVFSKEGDEAVCSAHKVMHDVPFTTGFSLLRVRNLTVHEFKARAMIESTPLGEMLIRLARAALEGVARPEGEKEKAAFAAAINVTAAKLNGSIHLTCKKWR